MTVTPTKAHDDCMPALAEIPLSLAKYGHMPVQAVFTDNIRGDKKAHQENYFCLQGVLGCPGMSWDVLGHIRALKTNIYPGSSVSKVPLFSSLQGR